MIKTGQLYDFIMEMMQQSDHDILWSYFLHKVYDKSFDEFVGSLHTTVPKKVTEREIETTIVQSMNMLVDFVPDRG